MTGKPKVRKPKNASRAPSTKATTVTGEDGWTWIRSEKPFILPDDVREALHRLDDAGHLAYVVGGSVRDHFLGRPVKDHDIATSADPDEISRLFPKGLKVGKRFGVIRVPVPKRSGEFLDIATFRKDLKYKDHRHPSGILLAGPREDARRRDFTINALYYDYKTQRVLDTEGGVADLKAGVLRAIGDPPKRFDEDALRLLRAVRFVTGLDFKLEEATRDAMAKKAKLIKKVSGERLREEMNLMLQGPRPAQALGLMGELDLLKGTLPELDNLKGVEQSPLYLGEGDVWDFTLKTVGLLSKAHPDRSVALSWAAVLLEVGKPLALRKNGGENFNGHELEAARIAKQIGGRLKLPKAQTRDLATLVKEHSKVREVFQMREATLLRFLKDPNIYEILWLHEAQAQASDGNLAYAEFCQSRLEELQASPKPVHLIDGQDLIGLGLEPGPRFSRILRVVEDLALEGKIKTKEEALEFVIQYFSK